ncbi:MAG: hypothetical protein V1875_03285 [Candidatus Altiarchaeota archaeon]
MIVGAAKIKVRRDGSVRIDVPLVVFLSMGILSIGKIEARVEDKKLILTR